MAVQQKVQTKRAQGAGVKMVHLFELAAETWHYLKDAWPKDVRLLDDPRVVSQHVVVEFDENSISLT